MYFVLLLQQHRLMHPTFKWTANLLSYLIVTEVLLEDISQITLVFSPSINDSVIKMNTVIVLLEDIVVKIG